MLQKITGRLITENGIIQNGEVCFENGKVVSAGERTCDQGYAVADYGNKEFVVEDIDGRWIAFGLKVDFTMGRNAPI